MADIIVTAGQSLSQKVPEGELCKSMTELVDRPDGTESMCGECGVRLMRTSLHGEPSIIASVPREDKSCAAIEFMKRRLP